MLYTKRARTNGVLSWLVLAQAIAWPCSVLAGDAYTQDQVYLYPHFKNDNIADSSCGNGRLAEEALFYAYSPDALKWSDILVKSVSGTVVGNGAVWNPTSPSCIRVRDPFMARVSHSKNTSYYFAATQGWDNKMISVASTTDLSSLSPRTLTMTGGVRAWAPEFYFEPASGLFYFFASDQSRTSTGGLNNKLFYSTTSDWVTMSPSTALSYFTVDSTAPYNYDVRDQDAIDATIAKKGDKYYLFYKGCHNSGSGCVNDGDGGGGHNYTISSSSLNANTWTQNNLSLNTGGTFSEGDQVLKLIGQHQYYRVLQDVLGPNNALFYSGGDIAGSWTAVDPATVTLMPNAWHGSLFPIPWSDFQSLMTKTNNAVPQEWRLPLNSTTVTEVKSGFNTNTATGVTAVYPGHAASALNFDGATGRIGLDSRIHIDASADFSVSSWVKYSATPGANFQTLACQSYGQTCSFFLQYAGDLRTFAFSLLPNVNTKYIANSGITPVANTWYHLVGVKKGSTTQIYVNGTLAGSATGVTGLPAYDSSQVFQIGAGRWNGANVDWTGGAIDEVRIYNRALSINEVKGLYNGLVNENFASNDTSLWSTYGGTWSAAGGVVSANASGIDGKYMLDWVNEHNIVYQADVQVTSTTGNAGLIFRVSDQHPTGNDNYNGYYVGLQTSGVVIGRADAGTWTQLALVNQTIALNSWNTVAVEAMDSQIRVYLNGSLVSTVTDTDLVSGGVGLRSFQQNANFRNVSMPW